MAYHSLQDQLRYSLVHIGLRKEAIDPYVPEIDRSCYDVIKDVNDTVLKHDDEQNARTEFNALQPIPAFNAFRYAVEYVRRKKKTDLKKMYEVTEERLMPHILASDLSDEDKIKMLEWCFKSSIPFSADTYTKMADVNVLELPTRSKEEVWSILQHTLTSLEKNSLNYNLNLETFPQRMAVMETLASRCNKPNHKLEEIFARTEFAIRETEYAGKIQDAYFTSGDEDAQDAKKISYQKTWAEVCDGTYATGKNKHRVDGRKPTPKPENAPQYVVQQKLFGNGR